MAADLRLVLRQARYQLIGVARSPRAVVSTLVLPAVLLVMFNSVFTHGSDSVDLGGVEVTANAYFTGGMLAWAITMSAFSQLAISLVNQRETGQLKRLRGTPAPAWTFIAATVLRAVAVGGALAVVLLAIGRIGYGVGISAEALAEIVLYVVLGTAAMCSLGIAVTAALSDVDAASAALPLVAVVLALISGVFVSIDQLPAGVAHVARIFPVYHLAAGLQTALGDGGAGAWHGHDALVLCVWALGAMASATRRFRWEPQSAAA